MVQLNKAEYAFRPGMTLKELVDDYNADHPGRLAFDGFIVLVNDAALPALQAREKTLQDNDKILIVPLLDGG